MLLRTFDALTRSLDRQVRYPKNNETTYSSIIT